MQSEIYDFEEKQLYIIDLFSLGKNPTGPGIKWS